MRLSDLIRPKRSDSPAANVPLPSRNPPNAAAFEIKSSPVTAPSAWEVYAHLIQLCAKLLRDLSQIPPQIPDLDTVSEGMDRVIECLELDSSGLFALAERSTPENYLPGHVANVVILAIAVSRELGLPKDSQRALGVGALLHDTGMVLHRPDYAQGLAAITNAQEWVKLEPAECLENLDKFLVKLYPDHKKIVQNIILDFEKRTRQGEKISQEAQIVGLCDTYESLSHPRPYREKKLAHDTLRSLIELSGESFDGTVIKALWQCLSLFPPGSYVQLSNGEIARVVSLNKSLPTRPKVKVIADAEGKSMPQEKSVDLSQTPGIAVEKAVDECALNFADPRLALELRAQRWWVK